MTSQLADITSELMTKLQTLPPQQQQQVLDFVEFLAQKYAQAQETPKKRIMGLHQGKIWMSDDFNNSLPDEVWMGKDVL
jgi:hypothetical protein